MSMPLVLPTGYTSGSALTTSETWNNTTLAGLGLTDGTYTWTWGHDDDRQYEHRVECAAQDACGAYGPSAIAIPRRPATGEGNWRMINYGGSRSSGAHPSPGLAARDPRAFAFDLGGEP